MFCIFMSLWVWWHCDLSCPSIQSYSSLVICKPVDLPHPRALSWCWPPFTVWHLRGDAAVTLFFLFHFIFSSQQWNKKPKLTREITCSKSALCRRTLTLVYCNSIYGRFQSQLFTRVVHSTRMNRSLVKSWSPVKYLRSWHLAVTSQITSVWASFFLWSVFVCVYLMKQMFFMDLYSAIRFWCFTVIIIKGC